MRNTKSNHKLKIVVWALKQRKEYMIFAQKMLLNVLNGIKESNILYRNLKLQQIIRII